MGCVLPVQFTNNRHVGGKQHLKMDRCPHPELGKSTRSPAYTSASAHVPCWGSHFVWLILCYRVIQFSCLCQIFFLSRLICFGFDEDSLVWCGFIAQNCW